MNTLKPLTVSVIASCRNEKTYIRAFCEGVVSQVLPPGWQLQWVIADGLSRKLFKSQHNPPRPIA
jgi:hypothetical protein